MSNGATETMATVATVVRRYENLQRRLREVSCSRENGQALPAFRRSATVAALRDSRIRFWAILLCSVAAASPADAPKFWLPAGVTPHKHTIELTIDPARDTFTGLARIEVTLDAPQTELWVEGRDLTVTEAWIEAGGKRLAAKSETSANEFIGIIPEKPVSPGSAVIGIRYSAPLSAQAVAGPNRKRVGDDWYVFTTFTPIDARRAFPCFDEPRFKTVWEMSIHVPAKQRAFANAPMVSETPEAGGTKLVQFAPTQVLAAEVAAFAVGPFDVWDGGKAGAKQTPVQVITARGQAEQGKEAAIATQDVLPRLEKYTGIPYPWEKLDHVALPQGAFGAVENPGLITYQSRSLLVPPAEGGDERRRPIRALQAHEIGHQWFGNVVTQADWTDVWLSEGFATWISAKMMDEDQPADRQHLAAVTARERIMVTDESPDSHPVRWPRQTREELDHVYNQFPYQKGAAILFMVEGWLGPDTFQKGLRSYLADHRMGNATTQDLEKALGDAVRQGGAMPEKNPAVVLDAFLNTTGVPAIKGKVDCGDGSSTLTIERTNDKAAATPVCWKTNLKEQRCQVLLASRVQVSEAGACPAWIYLNAGGTGYYRTIWAAPQLETLAGSLDKLSGAERLTLVNDLRAMRKTDGAITDPLLKTLTSDPQPEIARAAKVALGLEQDQTPRRRP
jgi:cytosol alanyl aminopeptidase